MNREQDEDIATQPFIWSGRAKIGAFLVGFSFVPWIAIAALPFISVESLPWGKVAITAALVVAGEVIQLIGVAIAGPDLVARFKAILKSGKWKS